MADAIDTKAKAVQPARKAAPPAPKPQPAPPAAKPQPAARAPGVARDQMAVGPETQVKAEKGEKALRLLAAKPDSEVKQTTEAVELDSKNKETATWSSRMQKVKDRDAIAKNHAAERAKLAELGPERTAEYDKVRDMVKHDPSAERDLQKMLLNDQTPQLTGAKDLGGGKDLLGHLAQIATQKNAPNVQTKELLRTLTRELANPNAISQGDGDIGTCVATTATIAGAHGNPAEIARLVGGLASEEGKVRLHPREGQAEGPELTRPANWNKDTEGFGGDRSPSVRLLQPALMNHALKVGLEANRDKLMQEHGLKPEDVDLSYDPRTDSYTPSGGKDKAANGGRDIAIWKELNSGGLDTDQGNNLLEHLTGKPYTPLTVHDQNRDEAYGRIRDAVTAGDMVPAGVSYKEKGADGTYHEGGHQMMVAKIDAKGVHVIDPIEGTRHVWSEAKFKAAVTDANLPGRR